MEKFLNKPFLPEHKVRSVVVSGENQNVIDALHRLNVNTLITLKNEKLEEAINCHADCLVYYAGNGKFFIDKSQEKNYPIVNYLTSINDNNKGISSNLSLTVINKEVKSPYPDDVPLNIKVASDKVYCNTAFVADEIKEYYNSINYNLIHVNQGYVGCSTALLSDSLALTDDSSISRSFAANGIIFNELSKGSIKLSGHDYGFIGGCCGMIDKNLIAFTGNIEKHKDCNLIKSFLKDNKIDYVCLTDDELIDIGSIIPITEDDGN